MDTRQFLRRYAYVYLYAAAFFLACAAFFRHSVEVSGALDPFSAHPVVVIDAGHGSMDGGTTGVAGTAEDDVNLAISRRLNALLLLCGCDTVMTRTNAESLSTEGDTIRQQKQSDLRNRVALVNGLPSAVLVSIHQNHYPDSRYSGPQVFWSSGGEDLAGAVQRALNTVLAPGNKRTVKQASGVYLMEHITHPGILVECGFLSNPNEEQKLRAGDYQKQLAAVLTAAIVSYLHTPL